MTCRSASKDSVLHSSLLATLTAMSVICDPSLVLVPRAKAKITETKRVKTEVSQIRSGILILPYKGFLKCARRVLLPRLIIKIPRCKSPWRGTEGPIISLLDLQLLQKLSFPRIVDKHKGTLEACACKFGHSAIVFGLIIERINKVNNFWASISCFCDYNGSYNQHLSNNSSNTAVFARL